MNKIIKNNQRNIKTFKEGFTLVEVMISIGLFTVIMVIGIGAVLSVGSTNRKTKALRKVIDNMSFVMEDMARSMRLGDYFYCSVGTISSVDLYDGIGQTTQDSPSGQLCKSISFEPYWNSLPATPENQIIYSIREDTNNVGTIWRKDETTDSFDLDDYKPVTPAEINIDTSRSGFLVTGSAKASSTGDTLQPRITIILIGTVSAAGYSADFNMQTTVSQRSLDIL